MPRGSGDSTGEATSVASVVPLPRERPEPERVAGSTLDLLRRVLIDGTLAMEQAFDLTGATLREELQDFRTGLMRRLAGLGVLLIAGGLLTAAFCLLLNRLLGS